MPRKGLPVLLGIVLICWSSVEAEQEVSPEKVGMSSSRLERAGAVLKRAVQDKTAGSAVGLIARNGRVVFLEAVGELAPGVPMRSDAIVRMASISKAITAVAVLSLYEDGSLRLSDSVSRFLPEYRDLEVQVKDEASGTTKRVAAERQITIHDLLTHQSGLRSQGPEVDDILAEIDTPGGQATVQDLVRRLAQLPLDSQPGTEFNYGFYGLSYEVLAAVAERASGKPFDVLISERVLEPLAMKDTYFRVPEEKRNRLAAVYFKKGDGPPQVHRKRGQEEEPNRFLSGGGGLRGTITDFYRFSQMLLNGGLMEGKQILSPKTVQLMTSDHVGNRFRSRTGDYGWGFGFAVRTRVIGDGVGSLGAYGWNGGTGTLYLVDPKEQLIVIVFVPSQPRTPGVSDVRDDFVTAAYHAIVKTHITADSIRTDSKLP